MADARTRSDDPPSLRVVRGELELALRVTDPDVVAELESVPEGAAREAHALKALRIGVTALQGARGQVDAAVVRKEGERLGAELRRSLDAHREAVIDRLRADVNPLRAASGFGIDDIITPGQTRAALIQALRRARRRRADRVPGKRRSISPI